MKEKELVLSQNSLTQREFDSIPLWEVDAATENRANIKRMETNMFLEGLREINSPWLSTIEKLNDRFYTRKGRAKSEGFAARAVMKWASDIEKEVDRLVTKGTINQNDRDYTVEKLELYASNKVNKELTGAKQGKLDNWREKGAGRLLANVLSEDIKFRPNKRNTTSLRKFVEHESDPILKQKPQEEEIVPSIKESQAEERYDKDRSPLPDSRRVFKSVAVSAGITVGLGLIYLASQHSEDRRLNLPQVPTTPKPEVLPNSTTITPLAPLGPESFSVLEPSKTTQTVVAISPTTTPVPTKNEVLSKNKITPNAELLSAQEIHVNSTPEPDYYHAGIDFSNKKETTIEIEGVSASSTPLVHWDSFNPEELTKYNQLVKSGTGNSYVSTDIYGNTIWGDHSGTNKDGKDNSAEELRKKIQGGGVKDVGTYLSEDEVRANVEKLIGQTVTIKQKDGSIRTFVVVASGIIPSGELNDEFNSNTKGITDTTIEATGGKNSDFNAFTSERGVIYHTCLHGVSPDPNKPGYVLVDQRYETLVLGLIPSEDAKLQNEVETTRLKEKENQTPLEKSARALAQIINMASSRVKDYGEKFKSFTLEQLKLFHIPVTREIATVVEDVVNETSDGSKIQCTSGADLLGTMPGSEGTVMDTYGWADLKENQIVKIYDQASDFISNTDGAIDPVLFDGGEINKYGANLNKIDSFSDLQIGDKIYIPKSPLLPDGHVVVVINSWVDNFGKTHLKIFDANYDNFGLARILEDVTEDNIYDQIAKGQKLPLFSMRPQEKSEQLASNTN